MRLEEIHQLKKFDGNCKNKDIRIPAAFKNKRGKWITEAVSPFDLETFIFLGEFDKDPKGSKNGSYYINKTTNTIRCKLNDIWLSIFKIDDLINLPYITSKHREIIGFSLIDNDYSHNNFYLYYNNLTYQNNNETSIITSNRIPVNTIEEDKIRYDIIYIDILTNRVKYIKGNEFLIDEFKDVTESLNVSKINPEENIIIGIIKITKEFILKLIDDFKYTIFNGSENDWELLEYEHVKNINNKNGNLIGINDDKKIRVKSKENGNLHTNFIKLKGESINITNTGYNKLCFDLTILDEITNKDIFYVKIKSEDINYTPKVKLQIEKTNETQKISVDFNEFNKFKYSNKIKQPFKLNNIDEISIYIDRNDYSKPICLLIENMYVTMDLNQIPTEEFKCDNCKNENNNTENKFQNFSLNINNENKDEFIFHYKGNGVIEPINIVPENSSEDTNEKLFIKKFKIENDVYEFYDYNSSTSELEPDVRNLTIEYKGSNSYIRVNVNISLSVFVDDNKINHLNSTIYLNKNNHGKINDELVYEKMNFNYKTRNLSENDNESEFVINTSIESIINLQSGDLIYLSYEDDLPELNNIEYKILNFDLNFEKLK